MKRSAMPQRTKPLVRASGPARGEIRPKKCKACRGEFFPASSWQTHCRQEACAVAAAEAAHEKRAKALRKQSQAERKADRAAKEAMKGVPELKREAQQAFNAYVRYRDQGKGCFVCGVTLQLGGLGGGFDAGHIRSRSQADHLRFDERNVHGQCKPCNAPGATKDHVMRAAAERLLGKDAADALYADNRVIKWTRDGLRQTRDYYRAKLTAMRAAAQSPSPNSGA